jgi:uncharacterized membrane protein YphA (DoxX/SURF4 family)
MTVRLVLPEDIQPSSRLSAVERYIVLAARYYFGAHTFISGINHYLLFLPDPIPLKANMTGRFMHSLLESGMYDVCKWIEIVAGFGILTGLFVPLSLILEMPVTMIIFYLSLFMSGTPRTIFTGCREVGLNLFLLSAYWGYFRPIFLKPRLPIAPIWRERFGAGRP